MKTAKLLYGAAYYDEYLPVDRIETDMEMIKKGGHERDPGYIINKKSSVVVSGE